MRNGKRALSLSLLAGFIVAFALWASGMISEPASSIERQATPTSSVDTPAIALAPQGFQLETRDGQLRVLDVKADTPSFGLMPGDVIVELDGEPVPTEAEFMARFRQKQAGSTIKLRVRRGEVELELQDEIGRSPAAEPTGDTVMDEGPTASDPLDLFGETTGESAANVAASNPIYQTESVTDLAVSDAEELSQDDDSAEFGLVLEEVDGRVRVMDVTPRRASEVAGVESGDILFQIDGDKLTSIQEFDSAVLNRKKGDTISLLLIRGDNIVIIDQMRLGGRGEEMSSRNGVTARIFPIASLNKESIRQLMANPLDLKAEVTKDASLDIGYDKGKPEDGKGLDSAVLPDDVAEFMATDIPDSKIDEPGLFPNLSDGVSRISPSLEADSGAVQSEQNDQNPDVADAAASNLNGQWDTNQGNDGRPSDSASAALSESGTGPSGHSGVPMPKTPPAISSPILSAPSPPADTALKLRAPLVNDLPPGLSSDSSMTRLTQIEAEELPSPFEEMTDRSSSTNEAESARDLSGVGKISSVLVPTAPLSGNSVPHSSTGSSAGSTPFYPGPITEMEPLTGGQPATPLPWGQDSPSVVHRELSPTMSDYAPNLLEGEQWGFQDPYCQGCGSFGPGLCICASHRRSFNLNRLLWGRDDTPVNIGGWVSAGYHSESNDLFNNRPDRFGVHQGWMYLEKSAQSGSGWGFRADLVYGIDAQDTQAFGNTAGVWDFRNGLDYGAYGWAVPQLYGELELSDWNIKLGHFYTLIGYDSVMAPDNFFYSHSITMYNSEPFTHTGVLASHKIGSFGTVYAGWTAGWDTGFDQFQGSGSWLGGIGYELASNLNVNYISTVGNFGARGDRAYSHSIVFDLKLNDCLSWIVQNDYLRIGSTGEDNVGVNQYLLYELTDKVAVGARMEWWKGDVQTGYAPHDAVLPKNGSLSYYAATLGVNYRPCCNFMCRPEVRHDWSPVAGYAVTYFGVDAVVTY